MIQHGDCILQYTPFKWNDPGTWLAPFIRFFDNIWNRLLGRPYCRYSHCLKVIQCGDGIWMYEAIESGFKKTKRLEQYLLENSKENILVLKPNFIFDPIILKTTVDKLCGTGYDWGGLITEMAYLSTDERVWIGGNKNKKVFCTKAVGYIYFKGTREREFTEWPRINPLDLYRSKLFIHQNL
jgi:hypothetical protein